MQQSLFTNKYKCPTCNTNIITPDGYIDYFTCDICNTPLTTAKQFIQGDKTTDRSLKQIEFVKFLISNNYISKEELIIAHRPMDYFKEYHNEFYNQAKYDVIVFNKSGGKILCNKKVSYQRAKEICQDSNSKFVNAFAGFCISGSYTDTRKGEPFNI